MRESNPGPLNRRSHRAAVVPPALATLAALVVLASCGEGGPLLFPGPATLEPEPPTNLRGRAGLPFEALPAVRLRDARGNPVPGVPVRFRVVGGHGVSPEETRTDADGRARPERWVLASRVGTNVLVFEVEGLGEARFEVLGEAGPPAALSDAAPEPREVEVGTPLPEPLAVRVTDAFGNPLHGHGLRFTVEAGAGSIDGADAVTDSAGVATSGAWTLGNRAGIQRATARLSSDPDPPVDGLVFEAIARAAAPDAIAPTAPLAQEGTAGRPVPDPPAVRIRDRFDNPVPGIPVSFTVRAGGGSVPGAPASSDPEGVAEVEAWTLGAIPGANRLEARVPGFDPIVFEAEGVALRTTLSIEGVQLNQASQAPDGGIGGIAGRPGLLRVFVKANEENALAPDLRVRLHAGGSLVREAILPAPADSVPQHPDFRSVSQSYLLALGAEEVVEGLSVQVVLDPDSVLPLEVRDGHRYPRDGGVVALDVQEIPRLDLVFFPVHWTLRGLTGEIHGGNVQAFLEDVRGWLPTSEIAYTFREPFHTDVDLSDGSVWTTLLSDLQAVRTAEGAQGEYYHGIVPRFPGIPWGGYAYIPPTPQSLFRTGLTYDALPAASALLAHELGHNLGRRHAPCGNPLGVDPAYPYPNGGIGVPGYDVRSGELRPAEGLVDYMGYCAARWASDYTWGHTVEWRRRDPHGVRDGETGVRPDGPPPSMEGLLLWGTLGSDGVRLNPALSLTAPPALPEAEGPHRLRGLSGDGTELFSIAFEGVSVGHGRDPEERHFALFLPLDRDTRARLERIELSSPLGEAHRGPVPPGVREPEAPAGDLPAIDPGVARLEGLAGERSLLRWDVGAYPLVVVRERESGRILGMLRGGEAALELPAAAAKERLEVLLSDGVRTRRYQPMP